MSSDSRYLLIDTKIVPEIFLKVLKAKETLERNSGMSVNDAVKKAGISRSAYYKYKDYVFPFYEISRGKVMTVLFVVDDMPGILSEIISTVSAANANILTIHQNLPVNGVASITITFASKDIIMDIKDMLDKIRNIAGVHRIDILARG